MNEKVFCYKCKYSKLDKYSKLAAPEWVSDFSKFWYCKKHKNPLYKNVYSTDYITGDITYTDNNSGNNKYELCNKHNKTGNCDCFKKSLLYKITDWIFNK